MTARFWSTAQNMDKKVKRARRKKRHAIDLAGMLRITLHLVPPHHRDQTKEKTQRKRITKKSYTSKITDLT